MSETTDRRANDRVRYVKPGEALAMDPGNIRRGPQGFFWMLQDPPKRNEYFGDVGVAVVHVRGELEHHAQTWGGGESYEGLRSKYTEALAGGPVSGAIDGTADEDEDEDGGDITPSPPATIITVIDSPGGVVSGLNQTCSWIRKLRKAHPETRFLVYVNEMAASAAYAIACSAADPGCIVAAPVSSVSGSIGVISTMISQARKNKKDGYDVELITSGARKADGHLHAPLNDDAKEVERGRVDTLARSFFKLVAKTRGLSLEKIEGLQAGIFLSRDAEKRGLVDEIMSFDDVILAASNQTPEAGGNKTDRRAQHSHASPKSDSHLSYDSSQEPDMLKLAALIKRTEKAIAAEKDPKKITALTAALEAYKKTKHTIEKHEEESGDEEDEEEEEEESGGGGKEESEDGGDDDGEESKKSKKSKAKAEEEEDLGDDDDKDADDEDDESDDEDEEEEEEEEEAKASLSLVRELTGMKGKKALGALRALAATAAQTAADVATLKKDKRKAEKASLIDGARGKYITKKEATWLGAQPIATVRGFVEMRQKSGVIVHTDESTIVKPKHTAPDSYEALPETSRAMVDMAVQAIPGDAAAKEAFKATLVKQLHASNRAVTNGVGRF